MGISLLCVIGDGVRAANCEVRTMKAAKGLQAHPTNALVGGSVTVTVKTALRQRHADKRYLSSNE